MIVFPVNLVSVIRNSSVCQIFRRILRDPFRRRVLAPSIPMQNVLHNSVAGPNYLLNKCGRGGDQVQAELSRNYTLCIHEPITIHSVFVQRWGRDKFYGVGVTTFLRVKAYRGIGTGAGAMPLVVAGTALISMMPESADRAPGSPASNARRVSTLPRS